MATLSVGNTRSFFDGLLRRDRSPELTHGMALPRRQNFLLEPLERRLLLSVDLVGVPNWVPEGPAPITDGGQNVIGPPPTADTSLKVGADNAIAVDPKNAKHLLVASVN